MTHSSAIARILAHFASPSAKRFASSSSRLDLPVGGGGGAAAQRMMPSRSSSRRNNNYKEGGEAALI